MIAWHSPRGSSILAMIPTALGININWVDKTNMANFMDRIGHESFILPIILVTISTEKLPRMYCMMGAGETLSYDPKSLTPIEMTLLSTIQRIQREHKMILVNIDKMEALE